MQFQVFHPATGMIGVRPWVGAGFHPDALSPVWKPATTS